MQARSLFLASLIAVSAYAQASVTLDLPVATAKEVMAAISAKLGTTYQVTRSLENERLYIRVTDVTEEALRQQIATALEATWEQRDGGWVLSLSPATVRKQEKAEYDRVVSQIKAQLNPEEVAEDEDGRPMMPFGSFATDLLKTIKPEELASMDSLSRKVFSTRPTSMQLPLGAAASQLGANYLNTLRERTESANGGGGFMNFMPTVVAPAGAKPAVINLIVQRLGADPAWTLNAILYGPNGEMYGMDFGFLGANMFAARAEEPARIKFENPVKVELDPAWRSVGRGLGDPMMGGAFGGGFRIAMQMTSLEPATGPDPDPKLTATLLEKLAKPGEFEPLNVAWKPVLDTMAESLDRDIVAVLPDRLFVEFARYGGRGSARTTEEWINTMEGSMDMDVILEDGSITIRSDMPARDRTGRTDRRALQTLVSKIAETESTLLADLAQYAQQKPFSPTGDDLDISILRSLGASYQLASNQLGDPATLPMLRYFGLMTAQQRDAMNQNRPLPVRGLHPLQQDVVKALTFHTFDGPQKEERPQPGNGGRRDQRRMDGEAQRQEMFRRMFALENERTVGLGRGIGSNAFVRTSFTSSTTVSGRAGTNSRLMSSWEVGIANAAQQNAALASMGPQFKPTEYRPFTQTNYQFRFELGGGWVLTRTLSELRPIKGAGYGAYDALPEAFRREAQQAEQSMQSMIQRGGGIFRSGSSNGP